MVDLSHHGKLETVIGRRRLGCPGALDKQARIVGGRTRTPSRRDERRRQVLVDYPYWDPKGREALRVLVSLDYHHQWGDGIPVPLQVQSKMVTDGGRVSVAVVGETPDPWPPSGITRVYSVNHRSEPRLWIFSE